jgi:hypothetical protein
MRQQITVLLPAVAFAIVAFSVSIDRTAQAADDCLARPNSTAPDGQHWYYHFDRAKNRQCWFLAAEGSHARRSATPKPAIDAAGSPSAPAPAKRAQAKSAPLQKDAETQAPTTIVPVAPAVARETAPFDFTGRWPGPPRQAVPSVSEPAPFDAAPVDAAPVDTVGIENDAPDAMVAQDASPMPATEVRPAVIKLAAPAFSVRPGALLALLAGALALAATLVHVLLDRPARRPAPRVTRTSIWDTPDPWRRPARMPAKPMAPPPKRPAAPLAPPLAPSFEPPDQDRTAELEQTLQRLLDNWRSRAA